MRKRVEETLDLLGLAELRRPRRCASCPAASSSAWRSARCSPRTRGCWCSTSRRPRWTRPRPRRCWRRSPGWCTTSASPSCWPSTGWSGSCSTPTGSLHLPGDGTVVDGPPAADARRPPRSRRRWSSSAGWPAGSRCRCRCATPAGRPAALRHRLALRAAPPRADRAAAGADRSLRRTRRRRSGYGDAGRGARGRPGPGGRRGRRADGPQRRRASPRCCGRCRARGAAARRVGRRRRPATRRDLPRRGPRALVGLVPQTPDRPALPRHGRRRAARRPTDESRRRRPARARRSWTGSPPASTDGAAPARPVRGPAAGAGPRRPALGRAAGRAARRTDPGAGLPREGRPARDAGGLAADGHCVVVCHPRRGVRRGVRRPGRRAWPRASVVADGPAADVLAALARLRAPGREGARPAAVPHRGRGPPALDGVAS